MNWSRLLSVLSFALAVGGFVYLLLGPVYTSVSVQGSITETSSSTLIEENGIRVIWLIALPAVVALAGVALTLRPPRGARYMLWIAATLLVCFCLVALLSVGIYYVPTALALLGAAIAQERSRPQTSVSRSP